MPPRNRYRFGDVLLPEIADTAATLPALLRLQQANELDRQKIALENKRIDTAKEQSDRAFEAEQNARALEAKRYQEGFEFRKEQARQAEMNRLVASVDEPYQKAMIYRKYGFNDLADNFQTMGEKQDTQKDAIRKFDSFTDPQDIIDNSAEALKTLDPTSEAATYVRNQREKAFEDLDVKYSELLEMPGFRIAHEAYKNAQKDLTMSQEDKLLVTQNYLKALQTYGAMEKTPVDEGPVEDFDDDDIDKLVDDIVGGRGLNLSTGEMIDTDKPITQQAEQALDVSSMRIGRVNEELKRRNKIIRNLNQQQNFRQLSAEEKKELQEQIDIVNKLESRMEEERSRGRAARKVREAAFGRPFG